VTVQSLATEIQQWVKIDGCTGSPVLGGAGSHKTSTWNTCASKSVVKLDIVEGEGHNWITGATSESWQFFSAIGAG
jgi:poly(3-hydroxybutyrate) depolymerase